MGRGLLASMEHLGDRALGDRQTLRIRCIEIDLEHPELVRTLARIETWPLTLTLEVCRTIRTLDFKGDPADEIIGATSILHKIPLVTRDRRIRRSKRVPLAL
jgi:PIN domain nuclease of toxin-antitoxin system